MTMKYTKDHEWLKLEGKTAIIGITSHAAEALGELVYVELPKIGNKYNKGDAFAVVESSKSASDVYMPISGKVTAINESLTSAPETINNSPYQDGWIAKVDFEDKSEFDEMMNDVEYNQYLKENS